MKYPLRCFAFILLGGSAFAQTKLPSCYGNYLGVWTNCFGEADFGFGIYVGEWQGGLPHGLGRLNGKYGYWANGNLDKAMPSSEVQKWINESINSIASTNFSQNSKLPECSASQALRGKNCFAGWKLPNGDVYIGEWMNGRKNGQGTYTIKSNGQKYEGKWLEDKPNGQGNFTYSDGSKYVGEWSNGKRHGQGIEYAINGSIIKQGLWVDDQFSDTAVTQQVTAPTISTEKKLPPCQGIDLSQWNGCIAKRVYSGGWIYEGEYKNGDINGQGTFSYNDGTKYIGGFLDGQYQGFGTLYLIDGRIKNQGIWSRGVFVGAQTVQQVHTPSSDIENEKLKEQAQAETEEIRRKKAEADAQLLVAQQQLQTINLPTAVTNISRRVALVIGNANYNSAPLKNPLNDAADISAALRQSGFEVIDQRNASLQEMTRGIREFGDKLLKSDVGLVYYSGHGLEVKGKNYLLPVNASMIREDEIAFQAIDANLILEKMNTAKKSVNILIVDACRDNPFARSFRSVNRGLAQMDAPTGTIVSFSTAPGKTASDGDGRNSPFTKNLVKAMMRADMPIEAMFKEVRKSVVEETKGQQTPWESSSLIGDFYFKVSK